jgi:hypothetical protein
MNVPIQALRYRKVISGRDFVTLFCGFDALEFFAGLEADSLARSSAKVEVQRVNLLDAAITHQERRVIRCQSYPAREHINDLRKIL